MAKCINWQCHQFQNYGHPNLIFSVTDRSELSVSTSHREDMGALDGGPTECSRGCMSVQVCSDTQPEKGPNSDAMHNRSISCQICGGVDSIRKGNVVVFFTSDDPPLLCIYLFSLDPIQKQRRKPVQQSSKFQHIQYHID